MYKYIFMVLLFLLFIYVKYNTNLIEGQTKEEEDREDDLKEEDKTDDKTDLKEEDLKEDLKEGDEEGDEEGGEDEKKNEKKVKDTSTMNNTKFFPSSGLSNNQILTNYIECDQEIRFPKIISKTKYKVTYDNPQVFNYTLKEANKSLYDNKSKPKDTIIGHFRPIITAQKNIYDIYDVEKEIEEYLINDPINDVYMHPESIHKYKIATFPFVIKPVINTLLNNDK